MPIARRRALRAALALALALLLHKVFCEWRTLEYAAGGRPVPEAWRLLTLWRSPRAAGNAAAWDERERELRAYDAVWLECHRQLRGEPARGSEMERCVAERPYPVVGATAQAVALGECEIALHGEVPGSAAIAACLRDHGEGDAHVPRWAFDLLGPRWAGPYVRDTSLYAEEWLAHPAWDRALALVLGIAAPAAALAAALGGLRRGPR